MHLKKCKKIRSPLQLGCNKTFSIFFVLFSVLFLDTSKKAQYKFQAPNLPAETQYRQESSLTDLKNKLYSLYCMSRSKPFDLCLLGFLSFLICRLFKIRFLLNLLDRLNGLPNNTSERACNFYVWRTLLALLIFFIEYMIIHWRSNRAAWIWCRPWSLLVYKKSIPP